MVGPPTSTLRIRLAHIHPRALYTCATVFGDFLGLDYVCITGSEPFDLDYQPSPDPSKPSLPCDGLLYQSGLTQPATDTIADPLSRFFRELSQFAAYTQPKLDAHQRHIERAPGLELHTALHQLREWLHLQFPQLQFPARAFSWELTIDIDQPWKHKHKPLPVRVGGFLRDLALLRFRNLKERLQSRDPFDTLETVLAICPPEKTSAFILAGTGHPNDSRFSLHQAAFQAYVKRWQQAGIRIGVHPSYRSSELPALVAEEKRLLEQCVGAVHLSRQHYLRYRLPDTFRALIAAGITHDYSLCPHEGLGARTGIALPYSWYDLAAEQATKLRIIPAVVMDRSLQQYLKLSPATAFGQTCAIIDTLRAHGGHFVLIFHNETLSESGEWKGWTRWIQSTVAYLQGNHES